VSRRSPPGAAPDVGWFEAEKEISFGGWRAVQEHGRPAYTFRVDGATHLSFMDVPFLPAAAASPATAMLAATTLRPDRMWRLTSDLLLAFFGRHLLGHPGAVLDGPSPERPELRFGPPE
jgi:hypothetical protein